MQLQQRTRSHEKMPQLQVRQAREALRDHRVWMQRPLRSRGWRGSDTHPRGGPSSPAVNAHPGNIFRSPRGWGDDRDEDGRSDGSVGESDIEDGQHSSCSSDADKWVEGTSSVNLCTGEISLDEFFENGIYTLHLGTGCLCNLLTPSSSK